MVDEKQLDATTFDAYVSAKDGRPFIQMTCSVGGNPVFSTKMSPDIATALGLRAIQSAIEAERDAGFIRFLQDELEMKDERAIGVMLSGMREHRQQFDVASGSMRPLSPDDPSKME